MAHRPQSVDDRPAATSIVAAIPARWASTRLPGKPLRLLAGRPMIQHVHQRVVSSGVFDRVVVLTDDERIRACVSAFGGECELTPAACPSGTDRIAWAAEGWDAVDWVVNIQGDEPLIEPSLLARVAAHLAQHPDEEMVTLMTPASERDYESPDAVKVVVDAAGRALYFSRAPIPHRRGEGARPWLHVGLYAYRRDVLLRLASWDPSPLERAESLEQLRALEHGVSIRVLETETRGFGVDTEVDLERAEGALVEQERQGVTFGGRPES